MANTIPIIADLDANFFAIGALVATNYVTAAAFTLVFGYLADKYKRKWLLVFGGATWATSDLLAAFSPNLAFLFAVRITASMGAGAVTPVTFSLLSDLFGSEKRSNSFAWWGIATMVGGLVGGSLSLAFNQIDYEALDAMGLNNAEKLAYIQANYADFVPFWRYPVFLMGLLGITFTLVLLGLKEPKRAAKERSLRDVLAESDVDYQHVYRIKRSDLKYIFTRKSNFFLIINFFDTVFSGVLFANIVAWITIEMGFNLDFQFESIYFWMMVVLFLIVGGIGFYGQFAFANWGDRKVREGDLAGRVKVAIFCGVFHVPFLVVGFLFNPSVGEGTFFGGAVHVGTAGFFALMVVMALFLALGFAGSNGIAPNWYSSLIDVNLPEHRGTMIATASFLDAIGRAFGAWVGGVLVQHFTDTGRADNAFGLTLVWMTLVFGLLSTMLWIPIYHYCNKDFAEVDAILRKRAEEMRQLAERGERGGKLGGERD